MEAGSGETYESTAGSSHLCSTSVSNRPKYREPSA